MCPKTKTTSVFHEQDRAKLQQVKILVEAFEDDSGASGGGGLNFIHSCLSEVVTNSKSKECGPFRLYDLAPGKITTILMLASTVLRTIIGRLKNSYFTYLFELASRLTIALWADNPCPSL